MNVGIYCDSQINGGHEEMLKRFILAILSTTNIESVYIFVPIANQELSAFVSDLGQSHLKIRRVDLPFTSESIRGNVLALLREVRKIAKELRTIELSKLLIAQGTIVSGIAGLLAARCARISAISYLPLVDEPPTQARMAEKLKWVVKRILYRVPNEYVTISDPLSERLSKWAPKARTTVVENYVDDRFSESTLTKDQARATLGLPISGTTIISHIGRLESKQKRQDFLFQAIKDHAEAFKNTIVLIIGEGRDYSRYTKLIEDDAILSACVKMIGPKEDVLPYVIASDTIVLPSAYEGVPLVMIEAVLAGRPIVASRVSSLETYLPESLLFPRDDSRAFVDRILGANKVAMAPLTIEFRRRFSRESFEARAQAVMLASPSSANSFDPATPQQD